MLFKVKQLQGIKSGAISLAFRKWKQARVKAGSKLKTAVGVLEVKDISKTSIDSITEADAKAAGFENRAALLKILKKVTEGHIYRIEIAFFSEDPRIALRNRTDISKAEFEQLKEKLQRLDKFSKRGPWVMKTLKIIQNNPEVLAATLAAKLGFEKPWFKLQVRKLKNLGLTISHGIGYSLSPLGQYVIDRLVKSD